MKQIYSIKFKLFLFGTLVIVVTASLIFTIGYRVTKVAIIDEAQKQALSVVRERQARLETWIEGRLRTAEAIALSHSVSVIFSDFKTSSDRSREISIDELYGNFNPDQSLQIAVLFDRNSQIVSKATFDPLLTIDTSNVRIQRSLSGQSLVGPIHLNSEDLPVLNFYAPVLDSRGKVKGVLFSQYATATTINPILLDTTGLGSSGEVFLVDYDMVMVTPSRFHDHPMHLKHKMPIPPVLAGIRGETGALVYKGFLGKTVVGAYTQISEYGWVIVAEKQIEEAFEPLQKIISNTLLATVIALLGLLIITSLVARAWTSPLERLADASQKVGEGDLSVKIEHSDRHDEIGILIRMFNQMVQGIARSQEELKSSHLRLLQSEKLAAIGRLVASIVHEMRNPLSAIKMNLRLLERKTGENSIEYEHIAIASGEAERLERMFDEVLDYSKPPELNILKSNPISIANQSINNLRDLAESHKINIELSNEIKEMKNEVYWDSDKIQQVLFNVIENAIQASDGNSLIRISISQTNPDEILYTIVDQGSGMSESVLERIYEPFYTSREDGVGLGMNNVKKFIEAHNGMISIDSEIGVGTTISISLPVEIKHG